jgi:hypothetical protein
LLYLVRQSAILIFQTVFGCVPLGFYYNFGFREESSLNDDGFPAFRQTLLPPSSRLMACGGEVGSPYMGLAAGGEWEMRL